MFCRKASRLLREHHRVDADQLVPYDEDLTNQVVEETSEHFRQILNTLTRLQGENVDWKDAGPEDATGVLIHHQSLLRNKRCLMAYVYDRMARIKELRWQLGAVLPAEVQRHLCQSEKTFFKDYDRLLGTYMSAVDVDLTVDVVPPKDPFIEVRVLENAGSMLLEDKIAHLEPNSVHLIKREEAEPLIMQGVLEHIWTSSHTSASAVHVGRLRSDTDREDDEEEEDESSRHMDSAEKRACEDISYEVDDEGDIVVTRRPTRGTIASNIGTRSHQNDDVIIIHHSMETPIAGVGMQVWRGTIALADYILHCIDTSPKQNAFSDAVVIELGGGTGLAGIIAARAARCVFITDRGEDVLDNCLRNILHNNCSFNAEEQKGVKVRELDWLKSWPPPTLRDNCTGEGSDIHSFGWSAAEIQEADEASILLAADVVYDDQITDAFFSLLRKLMPSGSSKVLYLAIEKRFNFTIADCETVAHGYRHFRRQFTACEGMVVEEECDSVLQMGEAAPGAAGTCVPCSETRLAVDQGGLCGKQIPLAHIPQYLQGFDHGAELELWEITARSSSFMSGR
ncbi:hypothetical protein CBR_g20274 [Chara braunii]|uniref:Uncharacterized protein n=1 Tax=Chara braunii TaxID=69332 RepID=A0A388L010_CHABU|nr:hypothetical protein CBR_g20274 [Chara braunii]|eukprot:GBG75646.1 hypothetical protein CBR_g20274 [Chara braunii]